MNTEYDKDGRELLPVYACIAADIGTENEELCERKAADASGAARIIRKHIAEHHGDADTGITANMVRWSAQHNAFCLDE